MRPCDALRCAGDRVARYLLVVTPNAGHRLACIEPLPYGANVVLRKPSAAILHALGVVSGVPKRILDILLHSPVLEISKLVVQRVSIQVANNQRSRPDADIHGFN